MVALNNSLKSHSNVIPLDQPEVKKLAKSCHPSILAEVYDEQTNIVVWERNISMTLENTVNEFLNENKTYTRNLIVSATTSASDFNSKLGTSEHTELSEDIAEIVDMFCCLFELNAAGLRLAILDRAMCPRFHVDNVPSRLVTTYHGVATQWLPHQSVNRHKLGHGNNGLTEEQSGLYISQSDIQQLNYGDVALLKGELWEGNQNAGLVHRSPALEDEERRLILTLDFSV